MLNILHIEDNLVDQMAFSRLLKREEISVCLKNAETILEAKKFLTSERFDLIICDLNLPDGSAFDLADFFANVPAILHTGHLDEQIKAKARQAGAFKVILKSGDLKPLLDVLKTFSNTPAPPIVSQTVKEKKITNENPPVIQQLMSVFGNDQKYVEEVILAYLDENPVVLERLHQAGVGNKRDLVVKNAHQLKSGYLLMGLKKLRDLAEALELNPPESQDALLESIQRIKKLSFQSYDQLKVALQNLK